MPKSRLSKYDTSNERWSLGGQNGHSDASSLHHHWQQHASKAIVVRHPIRGLNEVIQRSHLPACIGLCVRHCVLPRL